MTTGGLEGWKPAIFKSSVLTILPRPVESLLIKSAWDARESKVPLKDGVTTDGQSLNQVMITVEGSCGFDENTAYSTELLMYDRFVTIRGELDTDDTTRFEFFVYHETTTPTYRKFKDCYCKTFDFSVGDDVHALFRYNLEVFAEDPVFYTTAPGS